jgi:hypothetical protein
MRSRTLSLAQRSGYEKLSRYAAPMRDGQRRVALFAAALAISIVAALLGWRMLGGRPSPAPGEQTVESATAAEAPAPSALAPLPAAAEAEATRCPAEPPLESGQRISGTLSRLVFGRASPWGSASVGTPTRGSLVDGRELGLSDGIELAGDYHWGTDSVVRSIERAVREVRRCHPGSPDIYVGDISRERGGWLRPHRSHQAGLDADIGFYYLGPASWYERATAKNLDVVRTWALWRALVGGGNVDMIFADRSIQDLIKAHLAKLPAAEQPPEGFFEKSKQSPAIVRHAWGHATHFHVRFLDPEAVARGLALLEPGDKGRNRVVRIQPKRPAKGWPPPKKR